MKKFQYLIVFVLLVSAASAQTPYFGGNVLINENVNGNVIAAGGQITINGNVNGDVVAFGGNIMLNGDVTGNAVLMGGQITVNSKIKGDLTATGGQVTLTEKSSIVGNANIQAGSSDLRGKIAGKLTNEGWKTQETQNIRPIRSALKTMLFLAGIIFALVLGLIVIYLFPGFAGKTTELVRASALKSGLVGLIMLILTPFIVILFTITIIGIPVALLIVFLTIIVLLVSTIPVKIAIGGAIYRRIAKKSKKPRTLLYYATGVLIFAIIYEIPYLGGLTRFFAVLLGFGAVWILFIRSTNLKNVVDV